jgi:integrase
MSKVEDFLSQYSSTTTVKNYKTALRHYFKVFYTNLGLVEAVEEYFKTPKTEAEYENDFTKFFITIKDRPPITINVLISIVKQFLLENDIEFSEKLLRRLMRKRSGSGPVSTDRIPTGEELKRIISHMSLCWRAFILVLVSSRMRRGEALSMSLDDLDLTKRARNVILQKLSFYRGIFDLFGRASKPIPLQFLLMGFSIMILLLRHSIRGHTFNSLFHDTYAFVAIIGSGHKRSSG